jgi:hypothetical protein
MSANFNETSIINTPATQKIMLQVDGAEMRQMVAKLNRQIKKLTVVRFDIAKYEIQQADSVNL